MIMSKALKSSKVANEQQRPLYIRANNVAKMLSVTAPTVWGWLKRGILPQPVLRTEGTTLWRTEDIIDFIDSGEAQKVVDNEANNQQ